MNLGGSTPRIFVKLVSFTAHMCKLTIVIVSPRVPLVEVFMITNQGYWLLMVKDELSDRLKLIKHQIKIIQAKDDNDVVDQALGSEVHSSQRTKKTSNQDSKLKHQVKILIA